MWIFIGISLEVVMAVGIQIVVYWLVTWYSLVSGNRLLEECQSAFDPNSYFPQDAGVHLQADTASQPKRLQYEVVIEIQSANMLYSKTSSFAMHGQHITRFCIYLQIICKTMKCKYM